MSNIIISDLGDYYAAIKVLVVGDCAVVIPPGSGVEAEDVVAITEKDQLDDLIGACGRRLLVVRNPYARLVGLYRDFQAEGYFLEMPFQKFVAWVERKSNRFCYKSLHAYWFHLFGYLDYDMVSPDQLLRARSLADFGLVFTRSLRWEGNYVRWSPGGDRVQFGALAKDGLGVKVYSGRTKNAERLWCDADIKLLSCAGFGDEYPHSSDW